MIQTNHARALLIDLQRLPAFEVAHLAAGG